MARAFKQWNLVLRDYLRNETALRLTVGEDTQAIPVRIVDGMPIPFADVLSDIPIDMWVFLLHRSELAVTEQGLALLRNNFPALGKFKFSPMAMPATEPLQHVHQMVAELLSQLEKMGIENRLKSIDEDVLGAYYFHIPEVHLYWMVIGLMAGLLGVSVESLTVVVAAHELAHAYSHLGRDIDGEHWDVRAFAGTDLRIVEGLAQSYTQTICEKIAHRLPSAKEAFEKLLRMQGVPYNEYRKWTTNGSRKGEIVRSAMIQARKQTIGKYEHFMANLKEIEQRFAGRQAQ